MAWWNYLLNLAARVPIERILIPPRDKIKSLEKFAATLTSPESQKEAPSAPKTMVSLQAPEMVAQSGSTAVVTREGVDQERIAWQDGVLRGELWLLEGHLKNNCQACGGDVECCWKHCTNVLDAARETQSMTTEPLYREAVSVAEHVLPFVHPEDVKTEKYVSQYPTLTIDVSKVRTQFDKRVMGYAQKPITLEGAKKMAAEEAVKRVEEQWQLVQEPPDADLPGDTPMRQRAQELANRVHAGELSRSEAVAMLADDLAKEAK